MPSKETSKESSFAASLATRVGDALLEVRRSSSGLSDDEIRAQGDREAQAIIASALAEAFPDDAVLSEEAPDDAVRLGSDRVWIVDPLDGTREYAEGRHDWAVHIAFWCDGDLAAGAVALPGLGITLGDTPSTLPPRAPGPIRIAVSRSRPPAIVAAVVAATGAELVPMGSAGFKVAAVVRGEVDAYLHGGGQFEWDSAAPVVVARAAGAHTSRLDGSSLLYNRENPYLPDLFVSRPEFASELGAAIARAEVPGAE